MVWRAAEKVKKKKKVRNRAGEQEVCEILSVDFRSAPAFSASERALAMVALFNFDPLVLRQLTIVSNSRQYTV